MTALAVVSACSGGEVGSGASGGRGSHAGGAPHGGSGGGPHSGGAPHMSSGGSAITYGGAGAFTTGGTGGAEDAGAAGARRTAEGGDAGAGGAAGAAGRPPVSEGGAGPQCGCSGDTCRESCGNRCVDTAYDPKNCGACGHACSGREDSCEDGQCRSEGCNTGSSFGSWIATTFRVVTRRSIRRQTAVVAGCTPKAQRTRGPIARATARAAISASARLVLETATVRSPTAKQLISQGSAAAWHPRLTTRASTRA